MRQATGGRGVLRASVWKVHEEESSKGNREEEIAMTRKEAKAILKGIGVDNRFSLRMVSFNWSSMQVLTIKDWRPCPKANEIKTAFKPYPVIVEFEPAKGVVFVSRGGRG